MAFQTCPTDIVEAPAEQVWELLVNPDRLETWADVKVVDAPSGPLEPGDRVVMATGPGRLMRVTFDVRGMRRPEQLELDIRLPFGIVNHELIRVTSLGTAQCRVTYN